MKSTRDRILQTLLNNPHSSINELASAVGINAISVRHHLSNLQADNLVTVEEERHGVGRPRQVYGLTEKGLERFPTSYMRLTNQLLSQLKVSMPPQVVGQLFAQIANDLGAGIAHQVEALPIEEKLEAVKQLLGQEGFSVEWEKKGNQYLIHEITCPYYHIGQNHPEVCIVDQTIISTILSIPAEKINCVLHGDKYCTYTIPGI
jgi:DeoR family suf operon transcriptional repressor